MQRTNVNLRAASAQQKDIGLRAETIVPYPQDPRETRRMSDDPRATSAQRMGIYSRAVDI